ncbi:MAG: pantoate--beta-alanine ligase [Bdellovibrionota bacterium]
MIIATNIGELQTSLRFFDKHLGFVPTMGALHQGHLELVRQSKTLNLPTVMSIFVNPTQFGPHEDLEKYPRPFENDCALARQEGVDVLFAPPIDQMYTTPSWLSVRESHLSSVLCGQYRPGHFDGVCLIVLKLLQLVRPSHLFMGQKDGQQLRIIERMCEELFLPTHVVGVPTVRESDGLAMSSRNQYLHPDQREIAPKLYQALQAAKRAFEDGERDARTLINSVHQNLDGIPGMELQYVDLLRWEDFQFSQTIQKKSILALAAFLGKTRLIDNILLETS